MVVEAKSAANDVLQAYGEARLYAAEINRSFHMRLLSSRLEYLAAVLPTTPLNDKILAARVFDLMQIENRHGAIRYHQAVSLVEGFGKYLREQELLLQNHPGYADLKNSGARYVLSKVEEALTFARKENATVSGQLDLLDY